MHASATTTIRGVSILSRQRNRKADVFDIALSPDGIAIRRPGRNEQRMTWGRISQWEIEERSDYILLTLRGGGSVTPLVVKGWTLEDLRTVMREATASTETTPETAVVGAERAESGTPAPGPAQPGISQPRVARPRPVPPRATRRRAARRPQRSVWRMLVTIVALGALATAVTVVLLQSAGLISWSFLGPVA